jgi:hypothetical protein
VKRLKNYNRIMVLGTAGIDEAGEPVLTEIAKRRCDRAAVEAFGYRFKRTAGSILIAGGYSPALHDTPPEKREAHLMAGYIEDQYPSLAGTLLLEDESRTTKENFEFSFEKYPDFFEDVVNGERKLALVSDEEHLERAAMIGSWVLRCTERQFAMQPTWGPLEPVGQGREITPIRRTEVYLGTVAMAADE